MGNLNKTAVLYKMIFKDMRLDNKVNKGIKAREKV